MNSKEIFNYANGDRYERDRKDRLKNGKGIYYWFSDTKYEGEYNNDKMSSKGVFYYTNGDKHEGNWKNGLKMVKEFIIILIVINTKGNIRMTK